MFKLRQEEIIPGRGNKFCQNLTKQGPVRVQEQRKALWHKKESGDRGCQIACYINLTIKFKNIPNQVWDTRS